MLTYARSMLVRQRVDEAKDATERLLAVWAEHAEAIQEGWASGQHGSGNLIVAEVSILRAPPLGRNIEGLLATCLWYYNVVSGILP